MTFQARYGIIIKGYVTLKKGGSVCILISPYQCQKAQENWLLKESGILDDDYKYEVFNAYVEVRCLDDFISLVDSHGSRWDDDIILYRNYDWEDYGRNAFEEMGYDRQIPEKLHDFIDFEAYGKYLGDYAVQEYSDGLIEILR